MGSLQIPNIYTYKKAEDFSIPLPFLMLPLGEVLHSYREDLQHCPLEGAAASAQTPQH